MKRGKKLFKPKKPLVKRQTKKKFNYFQSAYVRESQLKNEEIERRRKLLEEQNLRKQEPSESEEAVSENEEQSDNQEEENGIQDLVRTFNSSHVMKRFAVMSESESDSESLIEDQQEIEEETDDGVDSQDEDEQEEEIVSGDEEDDYDVNKDEEEEEIDDTNVGKEEESDTEFIENSEEDAAHLKDPFMVHLKNDLDSELYQQLLNLPKCLHNHPLDDWPILKNSICQIPTVQSNLEPKAKKQKCILEDEQFTACGKKPQLIKKVDWNKLYIKSMIQENLSRANFSNIRDNLDKKDPSPLTQLQKELFSVINNYQDLLFTERTFQNEDQIRFVYCLHVINHILKTRTKIIHHNTKLQNSKEKEVSDEYRDQGLVRPKVLIVVPFKSSCLKIVEKMIAILLGEDKGGSVINKNRFLEDFGGDNIIMPKKNPKPQDYELTFKGNTDDSFKIGISVTKKALKLYSDFYSSDIIISSPLGLRMTVGAEGEEERDFDFLASIELLIMDQMDIFFMQNWDHVLHVLDHLHLQPKNSHNTDFSRVRSWCVNGWSKYYRQTLLFSSIQTPELLNIFNKRCFNYAGKVKPGNRITPGSIAQVLVKVPQTFRKFRVNDFSKVHEMRFEFFKKEILPVFKDSLMNHTLIFVPSYFDYVRLRNFFREEKEQDPAMTCTRICEYSKPPKVARARDRFFHSAAHFMLYTERFHFFHRIQVKGIRHLIFYEPPTYPHFYSDMCNMMQEFYQNKKAGSDSQMSVTTIYCKYDNLQLTAVVGSDRAGRWILSDKSSQVLVRDD